MKKFYSTILFLFFIVLFAGAVLDGKTPANYFAGKWDVTVVGTPQGDARLIVCLEEKDGKLTGKIVDQATNTEISPISDLTQAEKSVTFYFNAQGYTVSLQLKEKDKNSVTGSMMDMFDASGTRIEKK